MHNAAIDALGLNWQYLAFHVKASNLPEAVTGAAAMGYVGLNLTVPHKNMALKVVDHVDVSAKQWQAINTIVFEGQDTDGKWHPVGQSDKPYAKVRSTGYNTDAEAIITALKNDLHFDLTNTTIAVAGMGGAGRVAALTLSQHPIKKLYLINRTQSKADETAMVIRAQNKAIQVIPDYPKENIDLLINGTSLGLKPDDGLPIDAHKLPLKNVGAVFDMIYQPAQTALLKAAAEAGCKTVNGLGMLLYQGAEALALWTGAAPPVTVMRDALKSHIYG